MKNFEKEKLLNEILADESLAEFRRASLADGVAFLRRQRRRRFALRAGVLLLATSLCAWAMLLNRSIRRTPHHLANLRPPQRSQSPAGPAGGVRFISDDELLALFPDRPVALIGKPGKQRLVFLDQPHQEDLPRQ